MAFDYFKVCNRAGEERLIAMSPAMGTIARRHLAELEYSPVDVFYAQLYGSDSEDVMFRLADGKMTADEFNNGLIRWLAEWKPYNEGPFDANGNLVTHGVDETDDDADPLPEA